MSYLSLKIIILGEGGSGKSASVIRYIQDIFVDEYDPTIEDSFRKQIIIDDETCLLDILDTAGEEQYLTMYDSAMRNSDGLILLFALNSRRSFDKISEFYNRFCVIKETNDIPVTLIGNKCDLTNEIQVPEKDIEELANIMKCNYYLTSAKDNININEAFMDCFTQMLTYRENNSLVQRRGK